MECYYWDCMFCKFKICLFVCKNGEDNAQHFKIILPELLAIKNVIITSNTWTKVALKIIVTLWFKCFVYIVPADLIGICLEQLTQQGRTGSNGTFMKDVCKGRNTFDKNATPML